MQFTTKLVARLSRCRCPDHGVKTTVPPWAGKHSRFTLFFEAFAIEVLQACRTVKAAAALLGLSWASAQTIMDRAVERGLERREANPIPHTGQWHFLNRCPVGELHVGPGWSLTGAYRTGRRGDSQAPVPFGMACFSPWRFLWKSDVGPLFTGCLAASPETDRANHRHALLPQVLVQKA